MDAKPMQRLHWRNIFSFIGIVGFSLALFPALSFAVRSESAPNPVLASREFALAVIGICHELPPIWREAVGDYLISDSDDVLKLERELDFSLPSSDDIRDDRIPAAYSEFVQRAKASDPVTIAKRLGALDLILFGRYPGIFKKPAAAFEVAHGAVRQDREKRLKAALSDTLIILGFTSTPGAASVMAPITPGPLDQVKIKLPGQRISAISLHQFQVDSNVRFEPSIDTSEIPTENLAQIKVSGPLEHSGLMLTRQVLQDAYAGHVIGHHQADVYVGPAVIGDDVERGLFAAQFLKPREYIGEYAGALRLHASVRDHAYAYSYPFAAPPIVIDAAQKGNLIRYANHSDLYANAFAYPIFVNGLWHIVLIAKDYILQDAQILYNYGQMYFEGAPYMEDLRP